MGEKGARNIGGVGLGHVPHMESQVGHDRSLPHLGLATPW